VQKGPIRGSSARRSTGALPDPNPDRLNRAKAIAIASAAVAAAATAANAVSAAGLSRPHPGARKTALQQIPPRPKDRQRRPQQSRSRRNPFRPRLSASRRTKL
jgi:hypothetical protein